MRVCVCVRACACVCPRALFFGMCMLGFVENISEYFLTFAGAAQKGTSVIEGDRDVPLDRV